MSSLNKVQLIGHLGRDPEIRNFGNGGRVANLRVATTEYWKDRNNGERKERTEWHSVVVSSDPVIKFLEKYVKKGHRIYIEGKLETRSYDSKKNPGEKVYVTEVTIRPYGGELKLLEKAANSNNRGGGEMAESGRDEEHVGLDNGGNGGGYAGGNGGGSGRGAPDMDDDIPF